MKKTAILALLLLVATVLISSCYSARKSGCPGNVNNSSKPFRA